MAADVGRLPLRDFQGPGSANVMSPITLDERPFHEGLARGELLLQTCAGCARARVPSAPTCPYCRAGEFTWEHSTGRGTIFSWVRYHRGFVPEFEPLVPYVVVLVELDEGPRMIGRLWDAEPPAIGMAVSALVERWPGNRYVVAFSKEGGDFTHKGAV